MTRIGVFVCHCGKNIAEKVQIDKVVEAISKEPDVVVATDYMYMCSQPGQALVREKIKSEKLDRVVVAACSRHMHLPTFRGAAKEAGLNPYLATMANIREFDSWVTEDGDAATEKAIKIIKGVLEEIRPAKPLKPSTISVTPKALVIGGGIAGIQAALDIADAGYKVVLVEKEPSIGGNMEKLSETFPTLDCSQCILTPKMVAASRHKNIELMTNSEVIEVSGFVGQFKVKIKKHPRYVDEDKCILCDECTKVCPVVTKDEYNLGLSPRKAAYLPFPQAVPSAYVIDSKSCLNFQTSPEKEEQDIANPIVCNRCTEACEPGAINFDMHTEIVEEEVGAIVVATGYEPYPVEKIGEYGYGVVPDVVSGLEFERILSTGGPTSGVVRRPSDGKIPKSVAFIHCAGSRDPAKHLPYCSKICCMYSIKQALLYKHAVHDGTAINFYIDIRAAGKTYEEFYQRAAEKEHVIFVKGKVSEVKRDGDQILLKAVNTLTGETMDVHVDMVVLAHGIIPSKGTKEIAKILKLPTDTNGFLKEAHPKLRPVETAQIGMFIAGAAAGPKDIPETAAQASAAAAKALDIISQAKMSRNPVVAEVNNETCGLCMICTYICPYNAINYDPSQNAIVVNEGICEGCGSCAVACPSGSIELKNSTYSAISKQIKTLLRS